MVTFEFSIAISSLIAEITGFQNTLGSSENFYLIVFFQVMEEERPDNTFLT